MSISFSQLVKSKPRVVKNISLRGNLDSLANISPEIAWFTGAKKLILMTKSWFLWQEIHSCDMISILVTRNHFLWAQILRLNLSYRDNVWILQKNSLKLIHFVETWFPVNLPPWLSPSLLLLLLLFMSIFFYFQNSLNMFWWETAFENIV